MAEGPLWQNRRTRPKQEPRHWRDPFDDTTYLDDNLEVRGTVTADGVLLGAGGLGIHPDLAAHDLLGLATDAEQAAHLVGDPHTVYSTNAELDLHTSGLVDVHDATSVSILDLAGTFTAGEVEGALAELTADDVAHAALPNIHHQEFTNAQHDNLSNPHHPETHGSDKHSVGYEASGAVTTHAAISAASTHGNLGHSNALDHSNVLDHARAHAMDAALDHTAGTLGDLIHAAVLGVWTRLAGNTTSTKKFLTQTGTGIVSAAPVWDTIADADIPASIARDSELHTRLHSTTDALDHSFPGGTTTFLRADGTFAAPTAAASDPVYAPGSFTVATGTGRYIPKRMQLTGTQRATVQGTGRLRLTN